MPLCHLSFLGLHSDAHSPASPVKSTEISHTVSLASPGCLTAEAHELYLARAHANLSVTLLTDFTPSGSGHTGQRQIP